MKLNKLIKKKLKKMKSHSIKLDKLIRITLKQMKLK